MCLFLVGYLYIYGSFFSPFPFLFLVCSKRELSCTVHASMCMDVRYMRLRVCMYGTCAYVNACTAHVCTFTHVSYMHVRIHVHVCMVHGVDVRVRVCGTCMHTCMGHAIVRSCF